MKKLRKNVFKPFLFIGLGLIITTISFAAARIIDTPSRPLNVRAHSASETGCTVEYEKPENDGGAPVKGYNAEIMIDESNDWQQIGPEGYLIKELGFNYVGGIEGQEAIFRVNAENLAGPSEWSRVTNSIIFK